MKYPGCAGKLCLTVLNEKHFLKGMVYDVFKSV